MENNSSVRWGWLKAMYVYTVFGAGGFGLAMLLIPGTLQAGLRFPPQDPVVLGLMEVSAQADRHPALRSP
jgi:hypothetical protein